MPSYRELPPPPGLEAHVACVWTSHDRAARVLPDACADIVFSGGRLMVAGPATAATAAAPTPGQARCGVRFRVGSAGAALGLPAIELLALLRDGTSLPEAGRVVGLGERQLRRRFERAVGYGPATLVRIQRFQHFLALAEQQPGAALSRLAAEAGYADQAHLTRECRRLSGLSPAALLAAGATAAGEKSDPFKPRGAAFATLAA